MSNVVERYQKIKETIESMKSEKVVLSTKMEAYKEQYTQALSELKDKYSVNNLTEAKSKLEDLKKEMERLVVELDSKMKPFEGTGDY